MNGRRMRQIHHQLGKVHFELNETEAALASFSSRRSPLIPRDSDSLYWIGGIKQPAATSKPPKRPMPRQRESSR